MEFQVETKKTASVFQYIEIEFHRVLKTNSSKFLNWLANNQNDNYWDRFVQGYGEFETVILVNYGSFREKHLYVNIVDILNRYGNDGWEVLDVRSNNLVYPPNYDLDSPEQTVIYYSQNTIYTLSKLMTKQELIIYRQNLEELQQTERYLPNEVSNSDEVRKTLPKHGENLSYVEEKDDNLEVEKANEEFVLTLDCVKLKSDQDSDKKETLLKNTALDSEIVEILRKGRIYSLERLKKCSEADLLRVRHLRKEMRQQISSFLKQS